MPANKLAVDLYWQIRRLGAELVFALNPLTLTEYEAGELLDRLAMMAAYVAEHEKQREDERLQQILKSRGG